MDLQKVNFAGAAKFKPVLGVTNMKVNIPYPIIKLKSCNTRYGRSVLCETSGNVIFLPKRMSDCISDAEIKEANENQKLSLVFLGTANESEGGVAKLQFVEQTE